MTAACGASALAFHDLIPNPERLLTAGADAEQHTLERLNPSSYPGGSTKKFLLNQVTTDSNQDNRCCDGYPAEPRAADFWQCLFPWKWCAPLANSVRGFAAAGDAVMQMRFNQQRAGRSELTRAILRKELANIFAAPDGFNLTYRSGQLLCDALPHAITGGIHGLTVWLLGANRGQRLLQFLLCIFRVLHRDCLVFVKSFLRRARVRCSTTATTAGEVFIMAAISRLLRSSMNRSTNISAQRGFSRARAWRSQSRRSAACGP